MTVNDLENKKNLLVVIDMINGFINEGSLSDPYINNIVNNTIVLIKEFIKNDNHIIAFKDAHTLDSKEFDSYPVHCLINTSESDLVVELKPYETHMQLINKDTTNGFLTNEFQEYISKNLDLDNIIICGCCSDICVLQFALTLKCYLNTNKSATKVIVYEDAIETFNAPNHNRNEYNDMAVKLMKNASIEIR